MGSLSPTNLDFEIPAEELSIEVRLLRYVLFETNLKVVFVTGAGISVKSGVPLYRTTDQAAAAEAGANKQKDERLQSELRTIENDPALSPIARRRKSIEIQKEEIEQRAIWDNKLEMMATKKALLVDPRSWYRYFWFDTHHVDAFLRALPNETHIGMGLFCHMMPDRISCITQNVDRLHEKGGMPDERLVEIHGRMGLYRCTDEDCRFGSRDPIHWNQLEFLTEAEEAAMERLSPSRASSARSREELTLIHAEYAKGALMETPADALKHGGYPLPCCPLCRKVVIPMTLLFDEQYLTHDYFQLHKAINWVDSADVIVFVGTSFSVWFPELAVRTAARQKKLVFNVNPAPAPSRMFSLFTDVFHPRRSSRPSGGMATRPKKDQGDESADSILKVFGPQDNVYLRQPGSSSNSDSEPPFPSSGASGGQVSDQSDSDRFERIIRRKHAALVSIRLPADEAIKQLLTKSMTAVTVDRMEHDWIDHWRRRWKALDTD